MLGPQMATEFSLPIAEYLGYLVVFIDVKGLAIMALYFHMNYLILIKAWFDQRRDG